MEIDHRLLVLDIPQHARGRLPSPQLGLGAGAFSHLDAKVGFLHQSSRAGGVGFDVAGRDEEARVTVTDEVGYAPRGAADDGNAAGHAFEDDESKRF